MARTGCPLFILRMKLYWNIGSQPARAVKALLGIGGIEHESISVDLLNNQTRTPEFLKLNPLGQIPFLVTSTGLGIGESNAILQYLCEKYPEKLQPYYGSTLADRTRVNVYLSWYQSYFRPALFARIKIKIYGTLKKGLPHTQAQIKQSDSIIQQALSHLEKILKQTQFVAGSHPSIADLLIYFELTNLVYYDMESVLQKFQRTLKWCQNIGSIKQVRSVQEQWAPTVPGFRSLLASIQPIQK